MADEDETEESGTGGDQPDEANEETEASGDEESQASDDQPEESDHGSSEGSGGSGGGGSSSPSVLVRAGYFFLVGWWLTGFWLSFAWFFNTTIIGLPIGIKMINLAPKIATLKSRPVVDEELGGAEQRSLVVRGVYFVLVGWWFSAIWMSVAYIFTVSVIGLPVAMWMYNKLPLVTSLYRY